MLLTIIWFLALLQSCGHFFAANRECLNLLFKAVSKTILSWCNEQGLLTGFIAVMHTFGSVLNFHPHIHILWTEGGLESGNKVWRNCKYLPHQMLKGRFKYYLIHYLRHWAKKQAIAGKKHVLPLPVKQLWLKKFKSYNLLSVSKRLYENHQWWYVWIGEKLARAQFAIRYIGRYAQRPCISEAKILYYSFERQIVGFIYQDKISQTAKVSTVSVEEFIGRLVRHIPEKNFRTIRYYGFYANRTKSQVMEILAYQAQRLFDLAKLLSNPVDKLNSWRERIIQLTGDDPLICPNCKVQMVLVEIGYRSRDGPLKICTISQD